MRPSIAAVALLLGSGSPAAAERTGGGSGGGGALGGVSSGISSASHASPSSGGGGSNSAPVIASAPDAGVYSYSDVGGESAAEAAAAARYTGDRARFEMYGGLQKVHDSDGSWTLEAVVTDYRFRLTGTLAHYFETRDGNRLTMTMPSFTVGFRIDDLGPTAVFVQGGFVHASTHGDPMADSSITGPTLGIRVEHALARRWTLIGDAASMWFENDIRAQSARLGVRMGPVEGSVRVLDFNVGPALYGPELGLRF